MFNDFVLVGPRSDPAGVVGARDIADAMTRIAAHTVRFVSRADESGTHSREKALWTLAGVRPPSSRLIESGAGMAATLRATSEISGYTLTDRATFVQLSAQLDLVPVFQGGPHLLNTYAVIVSQQGDDRRIVEAAMALARWLADGDGREVIASFKLKGGAPGYHVWPSGRPREAPTDLPRN